MKVSINVFDVRRTKCSKRQRTQLAILESKTANHIYSRIYAGSYLLTARWYHSVQTKKFGYKGVLISTHMMVIVWQHP